MGALERASTVNALDPPYLRDLAPSRWIGERLHPFAQDAGSVIPDGFEDYARIFHPARRDAPERAVTWREIATTNGRTVHPEMQFGNIAGTWSRRSPQPGLWSVDPRVGSLPPELARALVSVLRPRTATPDRCWFAVWEGWGDLRPQRGVPTLELPHRRYYLAEGTVDDALRTVSEPDWRYQSASMWWPDDRSWFVSTEVDFSWTYVGGTKACIDAVLAHPEIEALRARLSDRITIDGDTLNPPPVDGSAGMDPPARSFLRRLLEKLHIASTDRSG